MISRSQSRAIPTAHLRSAPRRPCTPHALPSFTRSELHTDSFIPVHALAVSYQQEYLYPTLQKDLRHPISGIPSVNHFHTFSPISLTSNSTKRRWRPFLHANHSSFNFPIPHNSRHSHVPAFTELPTTNTDHNLFARHCTNYIQYPKSTETTIHANCVIPEPRPSVANRLFPRDC